MIKFQTRSFSKEFYPYNSYFYFCEFEFALTASLNNARTILIIKLNKSIEEKNK